MADPPDRSAPDESEPDQPSVSRGVLVAILAPILSWLVFMTVVTLIVRPSLGEPIAAGWRLVLMRDVSVASSLIAILAAVVAAILVEARARRR